LELDNLHLYAFDAGNRSCFVSDMKSFNNGTIKKRIFIDAFSFYSNESFSPLVFMM